MWRSKRAGGGGNWIWLWFYSGQGLASFRGAAPEEMPGIWNFALAVPTCEFALLWTQVLLAGEGVYVTS